jgi:hypothetical protein
MDLQSILAVSPAIRYVATNLGGQVETAAARRVI